MSLKNILKIFIHIFIAILFISTANAATTATIHGAVYQWDTFELTENAIIEVNSTPPQSIVAVYGIYSFDLVPGTYLITANYYQNNTLTYSSEDEITIKDDGDYVLDLLMLPAYSEELIDETGLEELSETFEEDTKIIEEDENPSYAIYLAAGVLIIGIVAGYILLQRRGKEEEVKPVDKILESQPSSQPSSHPSQEPEIEEIQEEIEDSQTLPADLREVLDILKANGGRITQKDLRGKLRYSEAKVSLMVSDLENRELVEKFKKGRGNIIILKDMEN